MVDTGSSMNLLSENLLERLQKARQLARKEVLPITPDLSNVVIKGVTSDEMKVKGSVRVPLVVRGFRMVVPCAVVPHSPVPVLLGVPAMRQYRLVPDVAGGALYSACRPAWRAKMCTETAVGKTAVGSPVKRSANTARATPRKQAADPKQKSAKQRPVEVRTSRKIVIPARTQRAVPVTLPKCCDEKSLVLLSPLQRHTRRAHTQHLVAVSLTSTACPVVGVANPTNAELVILPNRLIATLQQFNAEDTELVRGLFDDLAEGKPTVISAAATSEANQKGSDALDTQAFLGQFKFAETRKWLDDAQSAKLQELLVAYNDVFQPPTGLGNAANVRHSIQLLEGTKPIQSAPYRYPPSGLKIIEEHTAKMLKQGICRESRSPWASPVVLIPKKGGEIRFCVDFRKLNAVTVRDAFPLPRIDTLLDALRGNMWFSTLDLVSGYWQIPIEDDVREKTAFVTHEGLYEFTVMPFGMSNAPATFQRAMNAALAGLTWKLCLVYLDDIIVFSHTLDEHLDALRQVFDRLRAARLFASPKKCVFAVQKIKYLGHYVDHLGISVDPAKVEAVLNFPTPENVAGVRSFLGLSGYFRKFVRNYATRAAPLVNLTHENVQLVWSAECQAAFEDLKAALASAPVLRHPDFAKPFLVDTDASNVGLGAVLLQTRKEGEENAIAYASRTLQRGERKWSARELEALAIVWACELFRPYVLGSKFTVRSDHCSLQWLHKAEKGRLARWSLRLQEFDMKVQHRPGKDNPHADALSRAPLGETDKSTEANGSKQIDLDNLDDLPPRALLPECADFRSAEIDTLASTCLCVKVNPLAIVWCEQGEPQSLWVRLCNLLHARQRREYGDLEWYEGLLGVDAACPTHAVHMVQTRAQRRSLGRKHAEEENFARNSAREESAFLPNWDEDDGFRPVIELALDPEDELLDDVVLYDEEPESNGGVDDTDNTGVNDTGERRDESTPIEPSVEDRVRGSTTPPVSAPPMVPERSEVPERTLSDIAMLPEFESYTQADKVNSETDPFIREALLDARDGGEADTETQREDRSGQTATEALEAEKGIWSQFQERQVDQLTADWKLYNACLGSCSRLAAEQQKDPHLRQSAVRVAQATQRTSSSDVHQAAPTLSRLISEGRPSCEESVQSVSRKPPTNKIGNYIGPHTL